ncbi:BQ2448_4978 [Microbotryum intermedium]|uniref:BQ2448_4978 protein n=1 Tax=Microbotryum intermedium TaxID=269621 RepID=A0A238FK70_9BASI|nr:BQ2448_4978 [Microbotryum intermedium]
MTIAINITADGVSLPNDLALSAVNKFWSQASTSRSSRTASTLGPDGQHVDDNGSIYVKAFPHPLPFVEVRHLAGGGAALAATEAWRISNSTSDKNGRPIRGRKYKAESAIAGEDCSPDPSSVPWTNKLISTGTFGSVVVFCDVS